MRGHGSTSQISTVALQTGSSSVMPPEITRFTSVPFTTHRLPRHGPMRSDVRSNETGASFSSVGRTWRCESIPPRRSTSATLSSSFSSGGPSTTRTVSPSFETGSDSFALPFASTFCTSSSAPPELNAYAASAGSSPRSSERVVVMSSGMRRSPRVGLVMEISGMWALSSRR